MTAFDILEGRLKEIIKQTPVILADEARKESQFIGDLNREQLNRGQKADNTQMPDYVSDSKQPSAPGKITLKDTGAFQSAIAPTINEKGILIDSSDKKTSFLIPKYGEILGLNDRSKMLLALKLKAALINKLRK